MLLALVLSILILSLPMKVKAQGNTLCGYFQDDGYYFYSFYAYGFTQATPTGFSADNFESTFGFDVHSDIIWIELTDPVFSHLGVLNGFIGSYRIVDSCAPVVTEPTNTTIPPTNTLVPPTSTPIPTWTPIPPTSTRIPPTRTPIPPSSTSIPPSATIIPPTTKPTIPLPTATTYHNGPLPNDGYNPGPSAPNWLDGIIQFFVPPVEASYSPDDCQKRFAGPNNEYAGQCTTFVSRKRPDACEWITPGSGNAYQWVEQAQLNGGPFGLTISSNPHIGDIVVWQPSKEQECGGTSPIPENGPCTIGKSGGWEGCGHVAYVTWVSTDGKTMKIEEDNWGIDRTKDVINVLSCMKFISNPSKITLSPTAIATSIPIPVPGVVPTPSGQPSNPFQWIIDLFKP